jgi:hypothetical protein
MRFALTQRLLHGRCANATPLLCSVYLCRLEWFDGSRSAEDCLTDAAAERMDTSDSGAAAAPMATGGAVGVLELRHGGSKLIVDTSLLQGWHSLLADSASSSRGGLRFEAGAWYSIIGDVISVQLEQSACAFVRARVCRQLDDSFDLPLYEQTLQRLQLLASNQ